MRMENRFPGVELWDPAREPEELWGLLVTVAVLIYTLTVYICQNSSSCIL